MVGKTRIDKALEVILYVLSKGCTDMYNVLKVIYFADKAHIEKTSCTMYKEDYVAMKFGPVPSAAYDIIKDVDLDRPSSFPGLNEKGAFKFTSKYTLMPLREYNPDFFSDIDYDCLDAAVAQYGNMSMNDLISASHSQYDYVNSTRNDMIPFELLVESVDKDGTQKEHIDNVKESVCA